MKWVLKEYDSSRAGLITSDLGVSDLLGILIAQRTEDHRSWFSAKLSDVPNPFLLPDVEGLISFIKDAKVVGIFSDYDVDGVTSASMWREFLIHAGKQVHVYIPDRKAGYGPSLEGVRFLEAAGVECILFLDCGTDKKEILSSTKLPVAVVDHHVVESSEKSCDVFINPYRTDIDPESIKPFLVLCTAGLSFLLIAALTYKLGLKFEYRKLLDLAALGTVADMMLLTGVNRILVKLGLEAINMSPRLSLQVLLESRYQKRVTAQDLGFTVAPKINAAGRMEHADVALEVFDPNVDEVRFGACIAEINRLNLSRRDEERRALAMCIEMIEAQHSDTVNDSVVVVFCPDWCIGVIGILAGRLKERYHKPAFVLTECGGHVKGSARSTDCVDLGKWIQYAINAGVIESGGGHRAAGGLALRREQVPGFFDFVSQIPHSAAHVERADVMTSLGALANIKGLEQLEPFGNGNPSPRFWIPRVQVESVRIVKDVHAIVVLAEGYCRISVMAFNADFRTIAVGAQIDAILSYKCSIGEKSEYTLVVARQSRIEVQACAV